MPHNPNVYDGAAFGQGGVSEGLSIKAKLVNLISATRTLMRSESEMNHEVWLHSADVALVPLIVLNILM